MAKVKLPAGILFSVQGAPPTSINPLLVKNKVLRADKISENKISISISFELENAQLFKEEFEKEEAELLRKGYLPFKNNGSPTLDTVIEIKNFNQGQNQLKARERGDEKNVAQFTIVMDVDDGKIGGANARSEEELNEKQTMVK
jgi:hypothetical protein